MNWQKILKVGKHIGITLLGLIILFIIILNISPKPVSYFIRSQFEKGISTKPDNYNQYESKVNKISELTYPSKYKDNKLDLYLPKDGNNHPIIIWVHGGAFVGGDKVDVQYYATILASHGYAVLSANYERAPELRYPNQLHQLEDIYSYLLEVDADYSLDTSNLILAGDSAGAHLVAQFTLIQTAKEYADEMNFKQIIPADNIKANILYCGPFNVEKINNTKSLLARFFFSQSAWAYFGSRNWEDKYGDIATIKNHVTSNYPPTFISDGNSMSFEEHSRELAETLKEKNINVKTFFISKEIETSHEYQFKLDTKIAMDSIEETIKFLNSLDYNQTP